MTKNQKSKTQNVVFLLVFLKIALVFAQDLCGKKIVLIDPGHGGYDSGAVGFEIQEKDVTLNIALELLKWNTLLFEDELEIYLSRYKDTYINLSDRTNLAKTLQADIFISIHCNAASKKANGLEIFIPDRQNKFTVPSTDLAKAILSECHKKLGFNSRGIKTANFQVLCSSTSYFPAILIETGFVTHLDESRYFSKEKNIKAIALAILIGLNNHLKHQL
ncbi:N-acetylmuramoyl-L-alanine amidase [Aestuariibaculum sp. M13]|uniref:N-acetylmuramoyl-L-alanine amidase family protein n=1 Tax=Aestuariibaculum sp. M13 TaxID=2967132 RepID=UPI002159DC52|nr:N-acetylmuramoyl-L-alanine amidase [Aestuariibaculum sp. M13]MCR8668228.1 N-acetylmuramoyl-L-alanine amidase [Aestuariibaculum sp. M13]